MAVVKLSKSSTKFLYKVMAELDLSQNERPLALKLAFAKGIAADELPIFSEKKAKETKDFEFNTLVIGRDLERTLIKHLIINKIQKTIDHENELDHYILTFIEHGLKIMVNEIESLTSMDNYLLHLFEKHSV